MNPNCTKVKGYTNGATIVFENIKLLTNTDHALHFCCAQQTGSGITKNKKKHTEKKPPTTHTQHIQCVPERVGLMEHTVPETQRERKKKVFCVHVRFGERKHSKKRDYGTHTEAFIKHKNMKNG